MSHRNGLLEGIKGVLGVYPLRCRRCRHRWLTSAWAGGAWKFARCPRCYRQELTTWSEQYYRPSRFIVMLLRMGATPYRCAVCRCNFASFKRCKEKFSWRHETKSPVGGEEAGITSFPAPKADSNGAGWYPETATPSPQPDLGSHTAVHAPLEPTPREPAEDEASEPYL